MISCSYNDIYTQNQNVAKQRFDFASKQFEELFKVSPDRFFSAPGRSEVGGNHTDHNHGKVLAAGVSLDIIAAVHKSDDGIIQIKSEGFPMDTVDISKLEPVKGEAGSSVSLIRGVCSDLAKKGFKVGGFKAYTTSNVLKGSGLSSSAAFEVLVGTILNALYNDGKISPVEIAKSAQAAENEFFGKPSGLMDQMACSVGGFITIDFADPENPIIKEIEFDFSSCGHSLCIVDTKGSHADLTPDYAAVPTEMKAVAELFKKQFLRDVSYDEIIRNIPKIREALGDRAALRALHFYEENKRVEIEASALENGNFQEFLSTVKASGNSSFEYLQNVYSPAHPEQQGLSVALCLAQRILNGEGAYRVHGGGFAGTIQAFVPNEKLEEFQNTMNSVFGENSCHVLSIRPFGGVEVTF